MQLRDYQEKGVADIRTAFSANSRILYVGPCGMGKTNLFSYMSRAAAKKGNRTLILVHRRELIRQTSNTLRAWGVPHGIISPDHRQTYDLVQVASVQTVGRRIHKLHKPDFIIPDEAHHAPAASYLRIFNAFPDAKLCGFTASPARLDGKGLGNVFETMVLGPTTKDLIEQGYLSDFVCYAPPAKIDLSKIHTRLGDFALDEIAEAMDKAAITGDVIEHYAKYVNGAPSIAFCTTVAHAKHVAEQFCSQGWKARAVYGDMPTAERDETMEMLRNRQLNVVSSCQLIDEGFDCPAVTSVMLLRPTKSLTLHIQQTGRALRICEGKERALILDHVGNCVRLGLPTQPIEWSLDGKALTPKSPTQCKRCFVVYRTRPECKDARCPLLKEPEKRDEKFPDQVAGELRQLKEEDFSWTLGCNIALAKGEEFKALLRHAGGKYDRLAQIARIRKYNKKWIWNVMKGYWQ